MPKKDAEAAGRVLAPGMLVEVVVGAGGLRPAGGASNVTVTCKPDAVAAAAAKEWDGLNIGAWEDVCRHDTCRVVLLVGRVCRCRR